MNSRLNPNMLTSSQGIRLPGPAQSARSNCGSRLVAPPENEGVLVNGNVSHRGILTRGKIHSAAWTDGQLLDLLNPQTCGPRGVLQSPQSRRRRISRWQEPR